MEATYSVTEAQGKLPQLLRDLEFNSPVAITRHDKTVAYVISRDQMESIAETLELMADPNVMNAIRKYEAGECKFLPLSALDDLD